MEIKVTDTTLIIKVDKDIYNVDVLHKCFYWYGRNYIIDIDSDGNSDFKIVIQPKKQPEDFNLLINKIKQDLIDFKLRDIVTKETQEIRDLIIAKAFAYYDFDLTPEQEISDPVGFNPEKI